MVVLIISTDTVYIGMYDITNTKALERARIVNVKLDKANFSFVCYDLNNLSDYVKQIDTATSILKSFLVRTLLFYQETTICLSSKKKNDSGDTYTDNSIIGNCTQLGNPIVSTSIHDGMTL
jgi:tRNA A37 threonylcarbamoyladenosine synthetase subunit TsaC/SUA5/YrdC